MSVKMESSGSVNDETSELRACRACLATDQKLFELHSDGLEQIFIEVTGTTVSTSDSLPQHICSYCLARLRKSAEFRLRCREVQDFCHELCRENVVLTTSVIKSLNDKNYQTTLNTTDVATLEYIPNEDDFNFEVPRTSEDYIKPLLLKNILESKNVPIKVESIENDENITNFENNDFISENLFDNELLDTSIVAEEIPLEKPKRRKTKVKAKKEKVKKEVKKRAAKKEEEDKPKRTRMYNQKYEEDFESFSKQCNVEVIFLTKEQQLESILQRKEANKEHRFICDVCYMGFFTENAHKKHIEKHNPARGSHICEVCQQRFPSRKLYLTHARSHKRQFICKICKQVNKTTARAKLHYQWHEGFKFECPHCKKVFNAQTTKINHIRERHTKVNCNVCDETVEGTIELNKHKHVMHGSADNQPAQGCSDCGALFLNSEALTRHRSLLGGCNSSLKPCPACGDNFTMQDLMIHAATHHRGDIYKCRDCPSTFTSDRKLGNHWARVHADKPPGGAGGASSAGGAGGVKAGKGGYKTYMCEVCAKKFSTSVQLKYHQRVHTDERPYSCPLCPKRFRVPGTLRVHVNTHTGERPFKCRFCTETFKSYSQRHKHKLLVHTKERPYKCHLCDKTYVVSFDLKSHIQFTHLNVPRPPRNRNKNKQTTG